MEKLSALVRAVEKALAMAWNSSLISSLKAFNCVSSLLFPDQNSTSVADEKTPWEQLQEVSCKQQINEYCFSSRLASWKLKFSSSADSHGTNTFPHSSPNTCLSPDPAPALLLLWESCWWWPSSWGRRRLCVCLIYTAADLPGKPIRSAVPFQVLLWNAVGQVQQSLGDHHFPREAG